MSQFAPPPEPGNAAGDRQEALTPQEIDAVLADFRSWLEKMRSTGVAGAEVLRSPGHATAGASEYLSPGHASASLDLHTLLSQFVALRHEVNLQTKASRAQQEQNAQALNSLEKALDELEEARATPPADDNLRPLLITVIDLHDNLSLARREVQRTEEVLTPLLEVLSVPEQAPEHSELANAAPAATPREPRRSWWTRWFGKSPTQDALIRAWQDSWDRSPATRRAQDAALRDLSSEASSLRREVQRLETWHTQAGDAAQQVKRVVSSLITGYTMSLNRVERALRQFDLEAIPTVGRPFDPETMEVLEVVHEAGHSHTEVIEEVRRGYFWRGQVFRFAQVRVARPLSS